jgi:hypothetical protein
MVSGMKVEPVEVLHGSETVFVVNDMPTLKLRHTQSETRTAATLMAALGEVSFHKARYQGLTSEIQGKPEFGLSLEMDASIECIRYIRD